LTIIRYLIAINKIGLLFIDIQTVECVYRNHMHECWCNMLEPLKLKVETRWPQLVNKWRYALLRTTYMFGAESIWLFFSVHFAFYLRMSYRPFQSFTGLQVACGIWRKRVSVSVRILFWIFWRGLSLCIIYSKL